MRVLPAEGTACNPARRAATLGLCVVALTLRCATSQAQAVLSNLSATKGSPVYTTYAAPPGRSEFTVDEGYHLLFDDPGSGIDLVTDQAGSIGLVFKLEGEVRYLLSQMAVEPVIQASYSDLVRYRYRPFDSIQVDVFVDVYGSRVAIQEIVLQNLGTRSAKLDVYPFIWKPEGWTAATVSPDGRGLLFHHREPPDGWTRDHGVPFVEDLADLFLLGEPPTAVGGYSALGAVPARGLPPPAATVENYCVEWGLVHHADGSLCMHRPPAAQQVILLNNSPGEMLTEDAPKWGDIDPNIPGNGYQGCELGNFRSPAIGVGDSVTVIFTCLQRGEQGVGRVQIPLLPTPSGVRLDIQLTPRLFAWPPADVSTTFLAGSTEARITWSAQPGTLYAVYGGMTTHAGRFVLGMSGIAGGSVQLGGLDPDSAYAFVVAPLEASGTPSTHSRESGEGLFDDLANDSLRNAVPGGTLSVLAFQKSIQLPSNETASLRIIRGVCGAGESTDTLRALCEAALDVDLDAELRADEDLYAAVPDPGHLSADNAMLYWQAFVLLRQCMLPPEGACSYNYYVFSREPTWGWGHGGQVFHESLSMLAYGLMDGPGAMNSQRVYFERQHPDGYINYRTGPYLDETIETGGVLTSSAPWLSWIDWELFLLTRDEDFLRDSYTAGTKFYDFWMRNRDADGDGLCEWGGHAMLESVRDGQVAVWDQVGWPSNFEALDLNTLLVSEAQSLAMMAGALGRAADSAGWADSAARRAAGITSLMWDESSGFYYNIDRADHDFSFQTNLDLKRPEIITFLPLWAGIADSGRAARLVANLTSSESFWRTYGVPSLSAGDLYYDPRGYWNGPVWVQWQYLVFRGLLRYHYTSLARELAARVADNMIEMLRRDHVFYELYSPDERWAGHNQTYIWAGIVARMLHDLRDIPADAGERSGPPVFSGHADVWVYPNPFNASTSIRVWVPAAGEVRVDVYDVLGRLVRVVQNGFREAGTYTMPFDAAGMASGMYAVRLSACRSVQTTRILLVR